MQALWVTGDNTALQGFDAIVRAARDAKLPLIINIPFEEVAVKKLVLNHDDAKALGITFPPEMVQAASQ